MPKHRRPVQAAAAVSDKQSDTKLSKTMSWLLRHGAKEAGFQLQTGGFLYVDEVLSLPQLRNYSLDDVQRVVDTNEKKRFTVEPHPENGKPRIRANQGHSIEVQDLELTPIEDAENFPEVVHGTFTRNWPCIQKQGLKKMKRTHTHFAPGEPGESGVISGMRASCDIIIFVDLEKALTDGFKFFLSANNVILCPGNEDGILPPKYFKAVYQRHPRKKLSLTQQV